MISEQTISTLEKALKDYNGKHTSRSSGLESTVRLAMAANAYMPELIEAARENVQLRKQLEACKKQKEQF